MEKLVNGLIRRYGGTISCRDMTFRGFLQPSGSLDTKQKLSLIGPIPTGKYLFIGPGNVNLREGDTLAQNGIAYELRRLEPVWAGDKRLYFWGVCVRKGEAE